MPSVAIGCAAAIILSAVQSLGITLQRKSHLIPYQHEFGETSLVDIRRDSVGSLENELNHRHYYKRNLWLVGFAMFILANVVGSLVQLTTLPLIILLPLQSIGLIFNSVFSCWLLPGEHFTYKLGFGTLVISVGAFIIAYNGSGSADLDPHLGADQRFEILIEKFTSPRFLVWYVFTYVVAAVLVKVNIVLAQKIEHCSLSLSKRRRNSLRLKQVTIQRYTFMRGIFFGIISGTLTAHTFLFALSVVGVVVEIILQRDTPRNLGTYICSILLLLATLGLVGLQLVAFNLGLSSILTSVLYPLCFLVYNLVNLINDVLFNKLLTSGYMSVFQLLWVCVGLLGVLFGVVVISWDGVVGNKPVSLPDEQLLLMAKFPYERRVMSYEESELIHLIFSNDSV